MTAASTAVAPSELETQVEQDRTRQAELQRWRRINVGNVERLLSLATGSWLAMKGLSRGTGAGLIAAAVGGGLIHRGFTGHCYAYSALGIDTAHREPRQDDYAARGVHVEQSYSIQKSPQELYAFWRNFENLPRIMTHLESVQVLDDKRSHWVAKAPAIAGGRVEWDAEIIADEPDRLISWRSHGADVNNTGTIRFADAPGDRGSEVHVVLDYIPPAGQVGRWLAKLFGEEPQQQVQEDLRNFKRIMEAGEIPTIQGQPRGTCNAAGRRRHRGA